MTETTQKSNGARKGLLTAIFELASFPVRYAITNPYEMAIGAVGYAVCATAGSFPGVATTLACAYAVPFLANAIKILAKDETNVSFMPSLTSKKTAQPS